MKSQLEQLLLAAIRKLVGTTVPAVVVERTREAAHGDYTSNIAMRMAKTLGRAPREVALDIIQSLPASPFVLKAEVAGNGFINFFLAPRALAREIRRIHELGDAYGRSSVGAGKRVTVGSSSNAAYSESLANVLVAAGYEVERVDAQQAPREPIGQLFKQLSLLSSREDENPVYYVRYAHARVASAMKEIRARDISFDHVSALDKLELLDKDTERALIATLLRFPEEVESAAANCAPQSIVYYLREVANAFHTYYNTEKWFVAEDDLRSARLALVLAAGQVVRNGLALIGVSAPESM